MELSEAAALYTQALRYWGAHNVRHQAVIAYNRHQFVYADDRETPSQRKMDEAVAMLRLLGGSRPQYTVPSQSCLA